MSLPIDEINKYPVFYKFYTNAKIHGAKLTLREHSKDLEGMIICPGFFYKPIITGVKAKRIIQNEDSNE